MASGPIVLDYDTAMTPFTKYTYFARILFTYDPILLLFGLIGSIFLFKKNKKMFMILFGFMTELAAAIGIGIFISAFLVFGTYMFTYSNYLGEFIVLLLFGMRAFSIDTYLFGPLRRFHNFEKYETLIIRIMYGFALIYAAIVVKLLHPDLTTSVVTTWNLTQFHWLFPSDPLLVAFGAGIVECVIGLFIIFGFEMRLTVLISLFYITLSLLYFREMVWPHILLYGISFNLLVQPETFTLDHLFFERKPGEKP